MYTKEEISEIKKYNEERRKEGKRPLSLKEKKKKGKHIFGNILLYAKSRKQTDAEAIAEVAEVNAKLSKLKILGKTWVVALSSEQEEEMAIKKELTPEEYLEQKIYKSLKPGDEVVGTVPKYSKEASGKKSTHKSQLQSITEIQTRKTAIEKVGYKVGTQGYPENVEAFERTVREQKESKGRGRGRPRKYHSAEEKKKAHKLYLRKRAAEARKK